MIEPIISMGTATLKTTNFFLMKVMAAKPMAKTLSKRAVAMACRSGTPTQSNIGIRTRAAPVPPMVRAVVATKVTKKDTTYTNRGIEPISPLTYFEIITLGSHVAKPGKIMRIAVKTSDMMKNHPTAPNI